VIANLSRRVVHATSQALLLGCLAAGVLLTPAQAGSIRFFGAGVNDIDRVKIRIDDPNNSNPGPPADIGNGAFTIEFWIKGSAADNNNSVRCGAGVYGWIDGDIVIDRDRFNLPRSWGLSLGQGRVAFGVNVTNANIITVCGDVSVLDNQWHHVAVTRAAGGTISIFIDGVLDESVAGPSGDLSYPDDGQPSGNNCGGAPCLNSDPFIVIGAEKHDAVPGQLKFNGFIDEVRLSNNVRYSGNFTPSTTAFTTDANTAGLYHFDEATTGNCTSGTVINDAAGNASPGECRFGGSPGGPVWSTDTPISGGGGGNAGTLQFSAPTSAVTEGTANVVLTVTRTGGTTGAVSASYTSADGTAFAGTDYTAVNNTVSWGAGSSTAQTITVPITDDSDVEGSQTFTVTLSAPSGGATLGAPATSTVTITDNDAPGTIQLSASTYAVTEGTATRVVTVARVNGVAGPATVNYATSDGTATQGQDYTPANGTLTWNASEGGNKTFTVAISDDTQVESAETFNVTISAASGAQLGTPTSAVVTITDNDSAGTLQFSAATYTAGENAGTQTIAVSRSGGTSGAAGVNYATSNGSATSPADFTALTGSLNWADGETGAKTFAITLADDSAVEGAESFTVALSNPAGAVLGTPANATVTITDNDSSGGGNSSGGGGGGSFGVLLLGLGLVLCGLKFDVLHIRRRQGILRPRL